MPTRKKSAAPIAELEPAEPRQTICRKLRLELRDPQPGESQAEVLNELADIARECSEFGNLALTTQFVAMKHDDEGKAAGFFAAEATEGKGRYTAYRSTLSHMTRDGVMERVRGILTSRRKDILSGQCSLPTIRHDAAVLIRTDRGHKGNVLTVTGGELGSRECVLWLTLQLRPASVKQPDGNVRENAPLRVRCWVRSLAPNSGYRYTVEQILNGTYPVLRAEVLLPSLRSRNRGKPAFLLAYKRPLLPAGDGGTAILDATPKGLRLSYGGLMHQFDEDLADLMRRKAICEARRVQAWRILRGRRCRGGRLRRYRSGLLTHLERQWTNIQKTSAQQLAAFIVRKCPNAAGLTMPSPALLKNTIGMDLGWFLMHATIVSQCQTAGIPVTTITRAPLQAVVSRTAKVRKTARTIQQHATRVK